MIKTVTVYVKPLDVAIFRYKNQFSENSAYFSHYLRKLLKINKETLVQLTGLKAFRKNCAFS